MYPSFLLPFFISSTPFISMKYFQRNFRQYHRFLGQASTKQLLLRSALTLAEGVAVAV
jgi:hypothetical protein